MRYELLIFDFDGTLVDTVADIAHYANEVLSEHGLRRCSVEEVKRAIGWGVHELFKGLEPGLERDETLLEEAVKQFKERYRQNPVYLTRPFEGVVEMLEGPLKGFKKAIVTNKPQDITERILSELGLSKHFSPMIGMHAGYEAKPDPTSTLHVMKTLGVQAQKTLFIGDSHIDADTSKNAGVDFAWVSYGYDKPLPNTPVRYVFDRPKEWASLLDLP